MTKLSLDTPNQDDILYVIHNMSPEDMEETRASGIDPVTSFVDGAKSSTLLGIVVKDHIPVALYGVVPDIRFPETGVPWMIATPEFRRHPREGMALSNKVVAQMQAQYKALHNFVHIKHEIAIRWLEWCGFVIERDETTGPDNAFYYFHRSNHV